MRVYSDGDIFGELALLYNVSRAATVKTDRECKIWSLDRKTFNFIVKNSSQKKRLMYEDYLSKIPILQNIS